MKYVWLLWCVISLCALSVAFQNPWLALALGGGGGIFLGILYGYLFDVQEMPVYGHSTLWVSRFFSWTQERPFWVWPGFYLVLLLLSQISMFVMVLYLVLFVLLWYLNKQLLHHHQILSLSFPVVPLILASAVSLFASLDWVSSLIFFLMLIAEIFAAYLLIVYVDTAKKTAYVQYLVLAVGLCVSLGALFFMQKPNVKLPLIWVVLEYLPDLTVRRIHPNYVGGILTLIFPISFWCLVSPHQTSRSMYGAIFLCLVLGVLLTQSRGAILGCVIALVLTGVFEYRWFGRVFMVFLIGLVGLVFVFGVGWIVDGGAFAHTWETRKELWDRVAYIVQDFPITGIGMRTFSRVTDLLYPLSRAWSGTQVPHVHNLYMQVVVDVGLFGFVAFCTLLCRWLLLMWETFRMTASASAQVFRPWVLGVCGGVLAHLIYSMTDAIVLGEKAGVFLWLILGLGVALWQNVKRVQQN